MPAVKIGGGNSMSYSTGGGSPAIGGTLNFSTNGSLGNYNAAYANAAALNQQNYNNILAGYQQTMQQQRAGQQEAQARYDTTYNNVNNKLEGANTAQQQLLSRQYAQQQATTDQQLINRGLGNSTVQSSVNRGIGFDLGLQSTNSANQFAQLQAQYMSQLGLAGANYAGQAVGQNTALAGQQLDFMNSVQSPYPDARLAAQMQAQQHAEEEARKPMWGSAQAGGAGMTYGASRFGSFSGPTPGYGASGGMTPGYGMVGQGGGYGYIPSSTEVGNQTPYIPQATGGSWNPRTWDGAASSWNPQDWGNAAGGDEGGYFDGYDSW